jgi:hypothetical protein
LETASSTAGRRHGEDRLEIEPLLLRLLGVEREIAFQDPADPFPVLAELAQRLVDVLREQRFGIGFGMPKIVRRVLRMIRCGPGTRGTDPAGDRGRRAGFRRIFAGMSIAARPDASRTWVPGRSPREPLGPDPGGILLFSHSSVSLLVSIVMTG